ncbi:MAG: 5,10-methylenetetrahydrofolate reductase [Deltaproteobacteria bacterium]|nr:MAG: 5,10-methylenetetrahydrofolate reductase [Deltaproteobacteria bacterium]
MSLRSKLEAGEFSLLAEIETSKGIDVLSMVANARQVKDKVTAFVVPEMSNAVMRMSALGGAMVLQNKDMETVMQVNCRDRNQLALQADLLAAGACGIVNIIAVNGDDPSVGDHPQAKAVYDLEPCELLQAARELNNGSDLAGNPLSGATNFLLGATANVCCEGETLEREVEEVNKKIAAGAQYIITSPVFDLESVENLASTIDCQKKKVIPTVLLLKSVGMARYISQTQEYISIPDSIIDRIRKSSDKAGECIRIAREMIAALEAAGFGGVLISTVGWEHKLPEILL